MTFAESDAKDQLAGFIQYPPPIREMVAECNWYEQAATNTNWIILSWQTNAYILRTSKKRVNLWDPFDTNNISENICVRAKDEYSIVSWYKVLGVHIRRVRGLQQAGAQDIVTPMILDQQTAASIALTAGVPLGFPGNVGRTNDILSCRDNKLGTTATAIIRIDNNGVVLGFDWTNEINDVSNGRRDTIHGPIRYVYGGTEVPPWFPHEIFRDLVINGKQRTICHIVVHRLELGVIPIDEYFPERFLTKKAQNNIVNSNGVSVVTFGTLTRPVPAANDPRAKGIPSINESRRAIALVVLIILFASGPAILFIARWRRNRRM